MPKALTAATAPTTATSGPGNARSEPAQAEDHRQRARADEQRQALRVAEMGDEVPGLLEEVARPRADPEQLRQLADDDREREADDQALEHGRADELGQEAEAQQTRDQGGDARRHGQAGGERGEALVPAGARSATVAADRAAAAAMGPMTSTRELPRAAYSSSAPGAA